MEGREEVERVERDERVERVERVEREMPESVHKDLQPNVTTSNTNQRLSAGTQ